MILGKNLIVALDGVAIAGAKSCKLNVSQSFLEVCSPTEARVMEKVPKTYDWGISVDCLIPSSNLSVSLTDKLIKGTKCFITFTDGSGHNRAGFVYVKNCDEGGNVGSLATFSASFESSGALYKYTQYTTEVFWNSDNQGFRIVNNAMDFNNKDRTKGVEFTLTATTKAYVISSQDWAIVAMQLSDVSTYYGQEAYSTVGNAYVVGSEGSMLTTLTAGTYTLLFGRRLGTATIYILEEV